MATPVGDSYAVNSGGVIAAGRNCYPAWARASPYGEWIAAPNSTLSTSGAPWAGTSPGGTIGYSGVVFAWSGGVLNTKGVFINGTFVSGHFLVIFGGGHGDYGGNEIYAYGPMEADSPTWNRIIDPTIPAPYNVARLNGYPVSRHTYDTLVYLPDTNQMLCIGAPGYYISGNNFNVADIFSFNVDPAQSNPWNSADVNFPNFSGGGAGAINLVSGFNPVTKKAWGLGNGNSQALGAFDEMSSSWTESYKDNPNGVSNGKAAIDSDNNLFVFVDNTGVVRVQNLSSPTSPIYVPSISGSPPTGKCAIEYDPARKQFIGWSENGKQVWFLKPGTNPLSGGDPWVWSSVTPANGADPGSNSGYGCFGRFRYKTNGFRGAVLMVRHDQPVYFYKG